jgi:hypothetical protein
MHPRTVPDPARTGIRQKAIDEVNQFGPLKAYKEGMLDATAYWQDQALVFGLPSHWEHRGIVRVHAGENHADWRVYVERWKNIRMGLAESLDGGALLLLMLMPTDQMSLSQASLEARKRI